MYYNIYDTAVFLQYYTASLSDVHFTSRWNLSKLKDLYFRCSVYLVPHLPFWNGKSKAVICDSLYSQ